MNSTPQVGAALAQGSARSGEVRLSAVACQRMAGLFRACGDERFFDALFDFLDSLVGLDGGMVVRYSRTQRPQMMMRSNAAPERQVPLDGYVSGAYLLCPFYHAFLNGARPGFYRLRDVAPDDFESSEFYRQFHGPTFVRDEVDYLLPEYGGWAITLVLERFYRSVAFGSRDLGILHRIEPIVRGSVLRHATLMEPAHQGPQSDDVFHAQLKSAAANFASSLLTPREREILVYMLRGYSAALTGERLSISEGTVKHHRKSIHRKLDIGSQAELFSLFLNCIPLATVDGCEDPLELYQRRRASPRPPKGHVAQLHALPSEST